MVHDKVEDYLHSMKFHKFEGLSLECGFHLQAAPDFPPRVQVSMHVSMEDGKTEGKYLGLSKAQLETETTKRKTDIGDPYILDIFYMYCRCKKYLQVERES